MKTSSQRILVLVIGASVLQGCAGTGGVRADDAQGGTWHATGPNTSVGTEASPNQPVVRADTKDNFEAVVAAIHKQMQPGGRWQYIDQKERATIDGSFADMGKLYDQYGSVDKMDQDARVRLLADQSTVNAILTRRDGERLICQMEIPVGSHLPVKTCRTYAQIQAEQRAAQMSLQQLNKQENYQLKSGH